MAEDDDGPDFWDFTRQIPVLGGVQALIEGRPAGEVIGGFTPIPGGAALGGSIQSGVEDLVDNKAADQLAELMKQGAASFEAYRPIAADARLNAYKGTVSQLQPYNQAMAQFYGPQYAVDTSQVGNPFPEGSPAGPGWSRPQYDDQGNLIPRPSGRGYAPGALEGSPLDNVPVGPNPFTGPAFGNGGQFLPNPSSGYAPGALTGTPFEVALAGLGHSPGGPAIPPPANSFTPPGAFVGDSYPGGTVGPREQPQEAYNRSVPGAFDNPGDR